jgi:hypothetical protein
MTITWIDNISECNFKNKIITIDRNSNNIEIISRESITIWQIFLSYFNLGILANKDFRLIDVTHKLSKYEWIQSTKDIYPAGIIITARAFTVKPAVLAIAQTLARKALKKGEKSLYCSLKTKTTLYNKILWKKPSTCQIEVPDFKGATEEDHANYLRTMGYKLMNGVAVQAR